MYSVVMMMAMTGAPEMPQFGFKNRGCDGGGCYGAACFGGNGGCRGYDACGCDGGGRRKGGKRGGCGGLFGGRGCRGYDACGCHGYSNGCGCAGYAANCGCAGYANACGCVGGMGGVAVPMAPPAATPPPPMPPKNGQSTDARTAPATITVSLPADATLSIDGVVTRQTSDVRQFSTPSLAADQTFFYTLTAEIVREGQTLTSVQKVTVRAGETTNVSLPVEQFAQTVVLK
jgi:uncharacterized protein (TIGR03000 family)